LEEAVYADILLHLVDASSPMAMEQAEEAIKVLEELQVHKQPTITLLNKVDCEPNQAFHLRTCYTKTVQISALQKTGFGELLTMMVQELAHLRKEVKLRIPQSDYALISKLIEQGEVLYQEYEGNDVILKVRVPVEIVYKVESYVDTEPPLS